MVLFRLLDQQVCAGVGRDDLQLQHIRVERDDLQRLRAHRSRRAEDGDAAGVFLSLIIHVLLFLLRGPTLWLRLVFGACDTPHTAASPCVGLSALRAFCPYGAV